MKNTTMILNLALPIFFILSSAACDKGSRSYSIAQASLNYQQDGQNFAQKKIDILWVVDNSPSMDVYQDNLKNNFSTFINRFQTLGFDFHMAVVSTDAYMADYKYKTRVPFRNGVDAAYNTYNTFIGANPTSPYGFQSFWTDSWSTGNLSGFSSDEYKNGYPAPCSNPAYTTSGACTGAGGTWNATYAAYAACKGGGFSSTRVIDKNTASLSSEFGKNIKLGVCGSSDERAFSSFKTALLAEKNAGEVNNYYANTATFNNLAFRRADAFLAIIILSDEDDFSGEVQNDQHFQWNTSAANGTGSNFWISDCDYSQWNAGTCPVSSSFGYTSPYVYWGDKNYNTPAPYLHDIQTTYVDWLDTFANGHSNYSVNTIYFQPTGGSTDANGIVTGGTCASLGAAPPATSFYHPTKSRYLKISQLTNGTQGNLCDANFGGAGGPLDMVTNNILKLASTFPLDREPVAGTIVAKVNGVTISQDASNGWTYFTSVEAGVTKYFVQFNGTSVPAQGATINITYDPKTIVQ